MAFSSIFRAFRSVFKPGVADANEAAAQDRNYPIYGENDNADPNSDYLGNQWIRDADLPLAFRDESNAFQPNNAAPIRQFWEFFGNTDVAYIGQNAGSGAPCALYQVVAFAGDPTIAWDADPIYLQLFTPANDAVPPTPGQIPDFSMPVPRPPLSALYLPDVRTPFNGVNANSGGIAIAFSSTPDTYTAGPVGTVNVTWAYYSYKV